MSRPLGFKPSPPGRIDALNFCIQAYHWPPRARISSGDGRDWGAVEWRKMNRNFGMRRSSKRFHVPGPGPFSPALQWYNEQGATVRTLPQDYFVKRKTSFQNAADTTRETALLRIR